MSTRGKRRQFELNWLIGLRPTPGWRREPIGFAFNADDTPREPPPPEIVTPRNSFVHVLS